MYKHRGFLECQVSRESATVTWYKNKDEIKASKKHELSSEGVYRKLTINDVDSGDEATYTCDAVDEKTSCRLLVEGNEKGNMFRVLGVNHKRPKNKKIICRIVYFLALSST